MIASGYFIVEKFELKSAQVFRALEGKSSAQILVATDGAGALHAPGCEAVNFAKGDAVVVPACIAEFRIQPRAGVSLLKSFVPGKPVPEPEISLN